jgi:hypothetical protein
MEIKRTITFKTFKLIVKPADKPEGILVTFQGGAEADNSGWESAAGDRKKLEEEFKFMFVPRQAPSQKKGEYILYFRISEQKQKFDRWLDQQKKLFYGIEDDR